MLGTLHKIESTNISYTLKTKCKVIDDDFEKMLYEDMRTQYELRIIDHMRKETNEKTKQKETNEKTKQK
jgi:hypothetical protein